MSQVKIVYLISIYFVLMVFGLYTIDIDIIRLILVGFFFYLVQIWDSTLSPVHDLQPVRLLYLAVVFRTRWAFFGAHCTIGETGREETCSLAL